MDSIIAVLLCILTMIGIAFISIFETCGPFILGVIIVVWAIRKIRN